jgi:hypothetical protein
LAALLSRDIGPLVSAPYEAALDAFFSISWWTVEAPSEASKFVVLPEGVSGEEKTVRYGGSGTTAVPEAARARRVADPVFAISLAAITALAVAWPEMRKKGTVSSHPEESSLDSLSEGVRL